MWSSMRMARRREEEVVSPAVQAGEVEAFEKRGAGAEKRAVERRFVLAAVGQTFEADELVAECRNVIRRAGEELIVPLTPQDDPVREPREVPFDLAARERSRRDVHDRDRSDELLERQVCDRLVKVRVLRLAEDVRRRVDMRAGVQARVQRGHVELVVVVEALDGVDPRFRVAGVYFRPQEVGRDVDDVHEGTPF